MSGLLPPWQSSNSSGTWRPIFFSLFQLIKLSPSFVLQLITSCCTSSHQHEASVIMFLCLDVLWPVCRSIHQWTCLPSYIRLTESELFFRHQFLLLQLHLPLSPTCQFSFHPSFTQNHSDEPETASSTANFSFSFLNPLSSVSYRPSNTISRWVSDVRRYTTADTVV